MLGLPEEAKRSQLEGYKTWNILEPLFVGLVRLATTSLFVFILSYLIRLMALDGYCR